MKDDLRRTFGEIFNHDITALRNQLIEIQQYRSDRQESLRWFRKLRFLDVSGVPSLVQLGTKRNVWSVRYDQEGAARDAPGKRPVLTIPIVEEELDAGVGSQPYLAVSWKWMGHNEQSAFGCDQRNSYEYHIKRPGEPAHVSSFPAEHMDRVIQVAQSHDLTRIWIDKECIYQRQGDDKKYPRDQELGVQVMDLVYKSAHKSVGLLTTPLMHQNEVDLLAYLLNDKMFNSDKTDCPRLKASVNIARVQALILRILSDPRWSRAWILFMRTIESKLTSYTHMKRNKFHNFGNIPGELQVDVSLFREQVTAFRLSQGNALRWPSDEILLRAKRYKAYNTFRMDSSSTTTHGVLVDICSRFLQKDHDRTALLANALKFPTRLDISDRSPLVTNDDYSLSTALLALILLNGEILCNDNDIPGLILEHDLQSYLELCEYPFNPPETRNEQSFIDHCRFRAPEITHEGIKTQGWVFKLFHGEQNSRRSNQDAYIELTAYEQRALDRLANRKSAPACEFGSLLDWVEQAAAKFLMKKLESRWPGCNLTNLIRRNLNINDNPPPRGRENPAGVIFLKMLADVASELIGGRKVRLARLHTASQDSPPSAIFVTPEHGWAIEGFETADDPVYVFTSWENKQSAPRQERLASLRVASVGCNETPTDYYTLTKGCLLRNYGWVNGIWDVRGKSRETFTFPLRGISGSSEVEKSKSELETFQTDKAKHAGEKRKRFLDDDGRDETKED